MRVDKPSAPLCSRLRDVSGLSKQGKKKRDVRSVDMSEPPAAPDWVQHKEASKPGWDDTQVFPVPSTSREVQIVQRVRRNPQSGRLVDFCVSIHIRELDVDEGWCEIERVDCDHGYVHVDRQTLSRSTMKDADCVPPEVRENLDKAFGWAQDYIWDLEARLKGWA